MAQTTISFRIDDEDKMAFEEFCSNTGMNMSMAFNLFVKKVIREQRIPFEINTGISYDEIERAVERAEEKLARDGITYEAREYFSALRSKHFE